MHSSLIKLTSCKLQCVPINLAERSYDIFIGQGLLDDPDVFGTISKSRDAMVVTNTIVGPLYADRLCKTLADRFDRVHQVILPDGEIHKTWESLQSVFDALLAQHCDRKTVLFALGGGVVGDLGGFAAACYMRGIPFVQVPTTLLAQVDSSVGGKTAINHPAGKNMIGAFYQPLKVLCDLSTLKTLPAREWSAGLAEIIKYGPIADAVFFGWLEERMEALMAREETSVAYAVKRSCEIKAAVVGQDERESGLRAILNFGHTFGHAIESGMGYGAWLHGEAVGCGMVMASRLSERLGLMSAQDVARVVHLVKKAGLPCVGPILSNTDNAGRYLELMQVDKKAEDGHVRFVLIEGLGRAVLRDAPDTLVREVIDASCSA